MPRILRLLLLAACLGLVARAAGSIGDIQLKSGKVLHKVKVLSDEPDSLVVFATEGMMKVKKADLPPALAARFPEREAPPPPPPPLVNKSLSDVPPEPETRQARPPAAPPVDPNLFMGCLITNYQVKPVQATLGCVEVTIHNSTEAAVTIAPKMIGCITTDGKRHTGGRFFVINDAGSMTMKRQETIPASGDVTDVVYFQTDALDLQTVGWAR